MKKLTYVGLALMLSFAIGGPSAAQDSPEINGQTAAADSSITQEIPSFGELSEWSEDILLAQTDCGTYAINDGVKS